MNLILFGFKGCGKTHFGKLFAKKMHRKFIDTDDLIVECYTQKNLTVREIYKKLGEEGFRALEKKALFSLKNVKDSIISLGGGAVLDPENVEFLQKLGCLIYLKTSKETLEKRLFKDEPPAFLNEKDPKGAFFKMVQERRPIYESIPATTIDCDNLDEAGVLAALQSLLVL
ncbi:MAG: hypothetical protein FJZ64_00015 [Chlamydiae bacterium]|nr:hypothetical protein [Chlamydiota bacterium]